ncbi:MAG: hypothetical protein AAGI38_00690 [Bacteroidota bacterium]
MLLFVLAGVYGLHNGASLYHKQYGEIEDINQKAEESRQETLAYYTSGKKGPEDRPWVDVTTPFWAVWSTPIYQFKDPSPVMVYCIGQAEQYGFYKRVTFWSTPFDSDMAEEIANPERLQSGTLDFSFVILYLLPLLLLILVHNVKGAEADNGFLPLVHTQVNSISSWVIARLSFYVCISAILMAGLMFYGAVLTPVFGGGDSAFGKIFLLFTAYLLFWSICFGIILNTSNSITGSTLKMVGVWLLLAFIVPATVHQWVSTNYPPNLMVDWIDSQRDEQYDLFDEPEEVRHAKLMELFPALANSVVAQDSAKLSEAVNSSYSVLANELAKNSMVAVIKDSQKKNAAISSSYWFNPITFFQNTLNQLSQTHYQDYQAHREGIQVLVDRQNQTLVMDTWNEVVVDKEKYLEYREQLTKTQ